MKTDFEEKIKEPEPVYTFENIHLLYFTNEEWTDFAAEHLNNDWKAIENWKNGQLFMLNNPMLEALKDKDIIYEVNDSLVGVIYFNGDNNTFGQLDYCHIPIRDFINLTDDTDWTDFCAKYKHRLVDVEDRDFIRWFIDTYMNATKSIVIDHSNINNRKIRENVFSYFKEIKQNAESPDTVLLNVLHAEVTQLAERAKDIIRKRSSLNCFKILYGEMNNGMYLLYNNERIVEAVIDMVEDSGLVKNIKQVKNGLRIEL